MRVINDIEEMFWIARGLRREDKTIGFVPTMGALHEGHLTLIRQARKENDIVAVSIFVNPIQFGIGEDFRRYHRTIKKDFGFCRKESVDFVFLPKAKEMYQEGFKTYAVVEELSDVLCGKSRPGHFEGVATVVLKLFNILQPSTAYFGAKDAQQAVIIKRMVEDLNIPVRIKVMPVVREKDGLALSSRNLYLNKEERVDALILSQALSAARNLISAGTKDADKILCLMKRLIKTKKTAKIDYIAIVEADTLKSVKRVTNNCLIALAVWIGRTRLIDNMVIQNRR